MTIVLNFPARPAAAAAEPAEITPEQHLDAALHELLRRAVAAYRTGETKTPGSMAHRHQIDIAHAYLESAAILTDQPEAPIELCRALEVRVFDLRKLARIARDPGSPQSA